MQVAGVAWDAAEREGRFWGRAASRGGGAAAQIAAGLAENVGIGVFQRFEAAQEPGAVGGLVCLRTGLRREGWRGRRLAHGIPDEVFFGFAEDGFHGGGAEDRFAADLEHHGDGEGADLGERFMDDVAVDAGEHV